MGDDFYIVGIGTSAGGADALNGFFKSIDAKIGVAFVIVQHLSVLQKGYLAQTLSKVTDIPIQEVSKKTKIEKNNIYIIPPQSYMVLTDGHLSLKKRNVEDKINNAVDVFFATLAEKAEERAIGIILSGMGTDGAKGAQKIKEKGGVVMVQSPNTAAFSSMPFGTILSDHPDVIGNVGELAQKLASYVSAPEFLKETQYDSDSFSFQQETIQKIIGLVVQYSGINFREYKINTILRRIDKRIKINHLYSLEDYYNLLEKVPDEITALYKDLLIGVTEFFRDAETFNTLKEKVIPDMCNYSESQSLRIWVPACSTGEEAYTIALLLDDYIQANNLNIEYKLFATDINPRAVSIAGRGQFTEQIAKQIPEDLLERYFTKRGGFYEVSKELRKNIIFSVHNLLTDPPFIRLNLISCRNLFIYLKEEIQKKLLYTFNYSLQNEGYLVLGANETEGDLLQVFERLDSKSKIFRSKLRSPRFRTDYIGSFDYQPYNPYQTTFPKRIRMDASNGQEKYAEILVDKYAPSCFILSEQNEVLYTSGNVEKYLKFPKRRTDLNLFDMVAGNVSLALRNGLAKLKETETDLVIRNVIGTWGKKESTIDLYFSQQGLNPKLFIIELREAQESEKSPQFIEVASKDLLKEVERLEEELNQARKELQYNSDELEAINEELQSSNEEMKSSNEEMQTTNEELQSTNEELKTVNLELQHKIDEVTVLHDDVNNLFISTEIATLFLDRDLNIRKYTPEVQKYFNIRESDIGRPIDHYTYNFSYDNLENELKNVLRTLQPIQKEIEGGKGFAVLKIIPYKTDDMRIEGVILTFTDITDIKGINLKLKKSAEELQNRTKELEHSEKYWKSLIENTPDIIARLDKNGIIKYVNKGLESHWGKSPESVIGKSIFSERLTGDHKNSVMAGRISTVFKTQAPIDFYENFTIQGVVKYFLITLLPEWNIQNTKIQSVLLIARDISQLREAEKKIESKNRKLEELNQYMDNFVHAVAHDLRAPMTNLKLILELIEDESDTEKRNVLIQKFNKSVGRIDDILSGLIEIVDNQVKTTEKARPINVAEVIDKVIEQLPQPLPNPESCIVELKVDTFKYIRGYFYSIIRNVVSNSVKYQASGRPLKIRISSERIEKYVLIKVEDNGIGMDVEKVKNNLFKPFTRFNSEIEGKGIGLHIVKSMVEKTGGKIEVKSKKDKGTTFFIYLLEQ